MPGKIDIGLLLAGTVHESKNRLVHLLQTIEQLQSLEQLQSSHPQAASGLLAMEQDVRKLNHDLVRMLHLYNLKSSSYPLQLDSHGLHDFIDDLLLHFTAIARSKQLQLALHIDEQQVLWFDATLLELAISTVLFNALDHARSQIVISSTMTDGYNVIRIEDDGAGFTNPADPTVPATQYSTGLGLKFAAAALDQHQHQQRHGQLHHYNRAQGGACVELWLPC